MDVIKTTHSPFNSLVWPMRWVIIRLRDRFAWNGTIILRGSEPLPCGFRERTEWELEVESFGAAVLTGEDGEGAWGRAGTFAA